MNDYDFEDWEYFGTEEWMSDDEPVEMTFDEILDLVEQSED